MRQPATAQNRLADPDFGSQEPGTIDRSPSASHPTHDRNPGRSAPLPATGILPWVVGTERPLVTRPLTVTALASTAGIISCHEWADLWREVGFGIGGYVCALSGALDRHF
jgi:hypothetical protein